MPSDHNTVTEQSDNFDEESLEPNEFENVLPDDRDYHESDDELPLSMKVLPYYNGKDGTSWNKLTCSN